MSWKDDEWGVKKTVQPIDDNDESIAMQIFNYGNRYVKNRLGYSIKKKR